MKAAHKQPMGRNETPVTMDDLRAESGAPRAMSVSMLLVAAVCSTVPADAQSVFVVNSVGDRVMRHAPLSGALLDPIFLDLDGLTGGLTRTPYDIAAVGDELWVTDVISDTVVRFGSGGSVFLGEVDGPLDRVRGLHPAPNGGAWVCNSGVDGGAPGDALVLINAAGATVRTIAVPGATDVIPYSLGGVEGLLVADDMGDAIWFVEPTTGSRQLFHGSNGTTGIDTPRQLALTGDGSVLAAGFGTRPGIYLYDESGQQVDRVDTEASAGLVGLLGVMELPTGDWLFTNSDGVHLYSRGTEAITTVAPGASPRYIAQLDLPVCECERYCEATDHSSGTAGRIQAVGSSALADGNLTLVAAGLPRGVPTLFLASRVQAFVPLAGGSAGNLCLGGAIGRFVGPGQLQASNTSGAALLALDLTSIPTPTGSVPVAVGDAWSFQAWFRDARGGVATSNFTDGVRVVFAL